MPARIAPTPILTGEDARKFQEDIERVNRGELTLEEKEKYGKLAKGILETMKKSRPEAYKKLMSEKQS